MGRVNTQPCLKKLPNIDTRTFFFIPIGKEVASVEHQPVKLGTNDMEVIRNTYMRYKALEALKSEGIIQEIMFEN